MSDPLNDPLGGWWGWLFGIASLCGLIAAVLLVFDERPLSGVFFIGFVVFIAAWGGWCVAPWVRDQARRDR